MGVGETCREAEIWGSCPVASGVGARCCMEQLSGALVKKNASFSFL